MVHFILAWLVLALGILAASRLIKGVYVEDFGAAMIVAAIFGVLNFLIGWLIFVLIGVATLGIGFLLAFLTRLIVNAIVLKLTAGVSSRFRIDGFGNALLTAVVIAVVGIIADAIIT